MGINPLFQDDFFISVQQIYYSATRSKLTPFNIVAIKENVYVNLIPLHTKFLPDQLLSLQEIYHQKGITLVHLWEDVWSHRRDQVLSRIQSFCGLNKTLHGRKAKIVALNNLQTQDFFNQHHLQGYIKTKYNFGLVIEDQLVAGACFSATRPMKSKGENYHSAELIRFATHTGYTVVGGLGKLINHFLKQVATNDLMTYADRDWSLGKGYDQLNFTSSGVTKPVFFYVEKSSLQRYALHRLPENLLLAYNAQNVLNLDDFLMNEGFIKVFNTGNLKYHLFT